MTQQHIQQQIPDYVLGLLPRSEAQQVDQHTLVCTDCRQALRHEQELRQLIHGTLAAAAQPPANLRQFMPAMPPKARRPLGLALTWQPQLVPLTLVLFLLVGSLSFYLREQRGLWFDSTPTALAITATLTDSPTATMTETRAEEAANVKTTAVPNPIQPNHPAITATPAPNPTPIAALNVMRDS